MIFDKAYKIIEKSKLNKKYIAIALLGFVLIAVIILSEFEFMENKNNETNEFDNISSLDYSNYLESKLTEIIKSIEGAGETHVMITVSETSEYIYAKNDKNSNKITDNTSDSNYDAEYVIIEQDNNDTGLLVKVIEPKIRGVAIVCEGADNPIVQKSIYSTVSAVLNISTARISISKSEPKEKK